MQRPRSPLQAAASRRSGPILLIPLLLLLAACGHHGDAQGTDGSDRSEAQQLNDAAAALDANRAATANDEEQAQ